MKVLLLLLMILLPSCLFSQDMETSLSNGRPIILHEDGTYEFIDDEAPYNGIYTITDESIREWTEYQKNSAPMSNDIIIDSILADSLIESGKSLIDIHENTLKTAGRTASCRVDQQTGILYIKHENWGYFPSAVFSADFSCLTFFINSLTGLLSIGGDIPIAFRCIERK